MYKVFDCIDLQIEIVPLSFDEMSRTKPGEKSTMIRERVIKARKIQQERYKDVPGVHCNAQMTPKMMHQYAEPSPEDLDMLRSEKPGPVFNSLPEPTTASSVLPAP